MRFEHTPRLTTLLATLGTLTLACSLHPNGQRGGTVTQDSEAKRRPGTLPSLAESLQPLRKWFNAGKGKPRFLALLSPT